MGLIGLLGRGRGRPRAPQALVQIGLGGGAAPPPSFSSLFPFLVSYSYYLERGGILLPVGVGLLQGGHRGRPSPSPPPFIYGGEGHPIDNN